MALKVGEKVTKKDIKLGTFGDICLPFPLVDFFASLKVFDAFSLASYLSLSPDKSAPRIEFRTHPKHCDSAEK